MNIQLEEKILTTLKQLTFKKEFFKELYELGVDSTTHGVPRILKCFKRREWFISMIWSLIFITALAYCCITITKCVRSYYQFNVSSTISKIHNLPAPFPAVTICNINPFNEAYASDYIYNKTSLAKCFDTTNSSQFQACMNTSNPNIAFELFNDQIKHIVANDQSLTAWDHYWYGYDLQTDMTISCEYNGIQCNASNDFVQYWDNQYGNCYTFNKNEGLLSSSIGDRDGLKMELVVSK